MKAGDTLFFTGKTYRNGNLDWQFDHYVIVNEIPSEEISIIEWFKATKEQIKQYYIDRGNIGKSDILYFDVVINLSNL